MITAVRAGLVALIVGLIGEVGSSAIAMAAAGLATIASALDGLDGWAARRTGLASEFGARFDLETDGLLILALSVLVWRLGITGPWILLAGLLRYLFIAAGAVRPWMRRPLPPSRRRQTTCVAQIVGLVAALAPVVPRGPGRAVAASTLAALCYSFCVDTYWLWQRRGHLDAV
jgi:phosphatidylglycerophosphate synthase